MSEVTTPGPRLIVWLIPVIAWNVVLMPWLPEGYAGDAGVPRWLLLAENGLRIVTFAALFWLRERPDRRRTGRIAIAVGLLLYFASWIPLLVGPSSAENLLLALGPALTPALWLGALAWQSGSVAYGALAFAFLVAHNAHQIFAFSG